MYPNFFIAGAPKCGTTAMIEYLRSHPQVFVSAMKEPHFFATDMPGLQRVAEPSEYEALFGGGDSHTAVGEGSVFYLYSREALTRIRDRLPAARVIVMLRNPADLIHALHAQFLYSRNEDQHRIERAWQLVGERRQGRHIPRHCRDASLLRYDRVALLGEQLGRLLELFPREQVLWLFFDDFARDTRKEYLKVLDFLGLEDDGRETFPPVNQHKRHRWQAVGNFTQRPPERLVAAGLWLKRRLGVRQWGLLQRLRRMNRMSGGRAPLPPALRHEILEHYREDILRLQALTERPLGHWLQS